MLVSTYLPRCPLFRTAARPCHVVVAIVEHLAHIVRPLDESFHEGCAKPAPFAATQAATQPSPGITRPALQPQDREGLRTLGPSIHLLPRPAPSQGHGWRGGHLVPE